ncbi:MAG: gliding motility lipoprotein GldH, partial [Flavobacteriales bacterium]|nr:gliding motility lipoprotein GldH [Flavobacteriales bacterium]
MIYRDFEIEDASWKSSDVKSFNFEMTDTITRRDFRIHVRNDQEYPYSNMFLFVELTFPNGKRRIDTLDCPLATADGRWL